jgi:exodeoxyribonuclease VIII
MRNHVITESNAEYHARDSISASRLKLLRQSPRVYQATVLLGKMPHSETPAMKLGTAIHCAVLEPESYWSTYVRCPAGCSDKRTSAHKEWAKSVGDRIVLTDSEADTIEMASQALRMHMIAGKIIRAAELTEGSVTYADPETAADCRFRFDGIAGPICFDIKTIAECSMEKISRAIWDFGYHIQAAHYLAGLETLDPSTAWRFMFLFVETSEPWRVRVVELGPSEIELGRFERAALIRDLLARNASGDWSEPGENEVCSVSVPAYYKGLN